MGTQKDTFSFVIVLALVMISFLIIIFIPKKSMADEITTQIYTGANIINATGTSNSRQYHFKSTHSFITDIDKMTVSYGCNYSKSGDITTERDVYVSIGLDHTLINNNWGIWQFSNISDDSAINKYEFDIGFGVKYIFTKQPYLFSLSCGAIAGKIEYLDTKENAARYSIRPKFKYNINKKYSINSICFYQPAMNDFSDYIFKGYIEACHNVTDRTALKLRVDNKYISEFDYSKTKTLVIISVKI